MKITITMCFLFISLIVLASVINELHIAERQAAVNACKANPYQCVAPATGFASMH